MASALFSPQGRRYHIILWNCHPERNEGSGTENPKKPGFSALPEKTVYFKETA
jgi:hypothetical protein